MKRKVVDLDMHTCKISKLTKSNFYRKSQVDQKRCLTIVNGKEHMGRKLHITEYNPTSSEKSKSKENTCFA